MKMRSHNKLHDGKYFVHYSCNGTFSLMHVIKTVLKAVTSGVFWVLKRYKM